MASICYDLMSSEAFVCAQRNIVCAQILFVPSILVPDARKTLMNIRMPNKRFPGVWDENLRYLFARKQILFACKELLLFACHRRPLMP